MRAALLLQARSLSYAPLLHHSPEPLLLPPLFVKISLNSCRAVTRDEENFPPPPANYRSSRIVKSLEHYYYYNYQKSDEKCDINETGTRYYYCGKKQLGIIIQTPTCAHQNIDD